MIIVKLNAKPSTHPLSAIGGLPGIDLVIQQHVAPQQA